ncbi:corticotropin-releasing factor-binding protein isoform X2 [Dunckerocampus dactyliophorus]|uniref:corticotropin-releasing factor-binding protein isoform X2 n=1 Tax=Dunckerocampus dactyliophorus TaxID=161453 RepID=UPI0024054351|nr:corticotropin-releasing factor-binding protein isoform X2 [Dunckerocampus dactyliophorus]
MERTFRQQLCFLLLSLCVLKGDCRYIEDNDILKDELYSFFNSELRRETPQESIMYRRPLRCLDMVAVEGRFTFTAEHPQLSCAAFFMAEPDEVVSVEYDSVDIDCKGGDFITVFDGWVMKGEKFPSSQDHPLAPHERYVDYCDSASLRRSVRSSQNVAMIFFRVHNAGSGFSLTIRKLANPFPCNVISQSPEGSHTMVIPQQHRNCSFSIIYPVEIDISEFTLGLRSNFPKRSMAGCASETGDFVQLLGGSGLDTSKLLPITDLCAASAGPIECWCLRSPREGRLRQHGGADGVQRQVRQQGVLQLPPAGQPGSAAAQSQQCGGFLLQQLEHGA